MRSSSRRVKRTLPYVPKASDSVAEFNAALHAVATEEHQKLEHEIEQQYGHHTSSGCALSSTPTLAVKSNLSPEGGQLQEPKYLIRLALTQEICTMMIERGNFSPSAHLLSELNGIGGDED